jgi:hypothetical protein
MIARVTVLCSLALAITLALPVAAEEEASRFSGVFQVDVTNAYYFRGILQEREGVQIEPWTELYYNLYSADDENAFLQSVTVGGGTWLSFQSERTFAAEDPSWLYEADYYPLVSLGFAGGVSLTTIYYFYTSPNGAFTTVQELNMKLAWDDSDVFGAFAMKPWINVAYETENTSYGPSRGTGIQLGIAPTLYAPEDGSFTLTAPAEVGVSAEDYYEGADGQNHFFGYGSVGLLASIPLGFMPEGAGAWSLNVGGKYMFFGHQLESNANADTLGNRGRGSYPVGTVSLAVAF